MTTTTDAAAGTTHQLGPPQPSEGPAAAALLAAGAGALTLGLLTTLAEASTDIADGLAFYDRVGPLSGKTIIAVGNGSKVPADRSPRPARHARAG